jgi:hypothetical protein
MMSNDAYVTSVLVLLGTLAWVGRSYFAHHASRMASLEKRVDEIEAINQAMAIKHLTPTEIAILYRENISRPK